MPHPPVGMHYPIDRDLCPGVRLVASDSGAKWSEKVEKHPRERSFAARPEAGRLAAASPLSNPNTQHTVLSVGIAQGLSESMRYKLGLS